jgi:hypothetical protein
LHAETTLPDVRHALFRRNLTLQIRLEFRALAPFRFRLRLGLGFGSGFGLGLGLCFRFRLGFRFRFGLLFRDLFRTRFRCRPFSSSSDF